MSTRSMQGIYPKQPIYRTKMKQYGRLNMSIWFKITGNLSLILTGGSSSSKGLSTRGFADRLEKTPSMVD